MKLTSQRRLASSVMKASGKRVWFDQEGLAEIKESIATLDFSKNGAIHGIHFWYMLRLHNIPGIYPIEFYLPVPR